MLAKLVARLITWKFGDKLAGKKTYVLAAAAVVLAGGVLTGQDAGPLAALLGEGHEADLTAVIAAILGLGLASLRSGIKTEVKKIAKEAESKPKSNLDAKVVPNPKSAAANRARHK